MERKRFFLISMVLVLLVVAVGLLGQHSLRALASQGVASGPAQTASSPWAALGPKAALGARIPTGSAFTYQGFLSQDGDPIDDSCDFQFGLWDDPIGGSLVAGPIEQTGVPVSAGYLTVELDFGAVFDGTALWLEVAVQCPGDGAYATLDPRQGLTAAPYASYSQVVPWSGIAGMPAGFADNIDDDTTYSAGPGLLLTGTVFAADTNYLQRRVGQSCGAGYSIRQINQDGSVVCEADDDTTYGAGVGLDLAGDIFSVTLGYRLPQGCGGGQIAEWDGASWQCGDDDLGGDYWSLTGNAGTVPGTHFLGTIDGATLTLAVSSTVGLRLVPTGGIPNLIGGSEYNTVAPGVEGAVIGGGGFYGAPNQVNADYGTIGGGYNNLASGFGATVGGGFGNVASGGDAVVGGGDSNQATGWDATVGGGWTNVASGDSATIGGGEHNTVSGPWATLSGGISNTITVSGSQSTVGGGYGNVADGVNATIGGGQENQASNLNTTVGGGYGNVADGSDATIGGGGNNAASGSQATVGGGQGNVVTATAATVSGGYQNTAGGSHATIGGGAGNSALSEYATIGGGGNSIASGSQATVGGGWNNIASGSRATIGGGWLNNAGALYATVGGGGMNTASGDSATIGGGADNTASGLVATVAGGGGNTAGGDFSTVGGGADNTANNEYATVGGGWINIAGGSRSTVGGGYNNTADGLFATIPGGSWNTAQGDYSFAAGNRAKAYNPGCFVWGDASGADITCSIHNRTVFRSSGGYYIYTNGDLSSGMYLSAAGSSWNAVSDRGRKENLKPVDNQELLARLATIDIATWNYIAQDPSIRHIGPMADDFNGLVDGLGGEGEDYINSLDADGVALAAVQGLYEQNQALQQRVDDLEARLAAVETGSSGRAAGSFLPWAGALLAGVGLAWVVRRRDAGLS
jgi:hypothetical protein